MKYVDTHHYFLNILYLTVRYVHLHMSGCLAVLYTSQLPIWPPKVTKKKENHLLFYQMWARRRDDTDYRGPLGKYCHFTGIWSDSGSSSLRVTHVSGEIFIWPSTTRINELERIIHISIISLPLHSPLLSDLPTCTAYPMHRRFIPVAAAIRTRPTVAHWLRYERKKKWDSKD